MPVYSGGLWLRFLLSGLAVLWQIRQGPVLAATVQLRSCNGSGGLLHRAGKPHAVRIDRRACRREGGHVLAPSRVETVMVFPIRHCGRNGAAPRSVPPHLDVLVAAVASCLLMARRLAGSIGEAERCPAGGARPRGPAGRCPPASRRAGADSDRRIRGQAGRERCQQRLYDRWHELNRQSH